MRKTLTNLALAAALGMGLGLSAPALAQSGKPDSGKQGDQPKVDIAKAVKKDLIIFRSGKQVEGVVLSESATEVKFLVIVGTLRSEATYPKSDILEIKKDAFKPEADAGKKDEKKGEDKDDTGVEPINPAAPVDVNGKPVPAENVKVYIVNFTGEFGRDLSRTPLKKIMDEAAAVKPDVLIVRFDHVFSLYGQQRDDWDIGQGDYDQLEKARELDTLLGDRLATDPAFKNTKPVAWVKKAMGGAAFLPFTFQDIYYTSDAHHGGIGGLERMFGNTGDQVVREKQRSLRLGRAKGLAAKGKHDERIMAAMSDGRYIMSYRMEGGKAELLMRMPESPDEILLKDDGAVNQDRADIMQDVIRLKGNDYLTLDAKTAFDIGFTKGTADSVDELLSKMGITRNYSVLKNNSARVTAAWSREVGRAEADIQRLLREYRGVQVRPPGGYRERTAARGQRKSLLRQVQGIADRFREAINPRQLGDVDGLISRINIIIDEIDQQQRLDRPDQP